MQVFTLISLAVAILLGFKRKVNTGIISFGMAFLVGYFLLGYSAREISAGFPTSLFIALLGITSLFSVARVNGTLELVVQKTSMLAGSKRKLMPIIFFLVSFLLTALGPGNPAGNAIMYPIALAFADSEEIPDILMILCVGCGTTAGSVSPISATGVITKTLAENIGVTNYTPIFLSLIVTAIITVVVIYFVYKGHRLEDKPLSQLGKRDIPKFTTNQIITLVVLVVVLGSIAFLKMDVGLAAITGTAVLLLLGVANEAEAIKSCPWGVYIMVGGVTVLVNLVNKAGGITALSDYLASIMTPLTAGPIFVFMGGLLSSVSSGFSVALPTIIPTIPGIVEALGEGVSSSNLSSCATVGALMVAFSPFSTMGALALANATPKSDKIKLFSQLVIVAVLGTLFPALLALAGVYEMFG